MKKLSTTTVYKVVCQINGELVSAFVGRKELVNHWSFTRRYAIGKQTFPVPGTRLFVFLKLEDALSYKSVPSYKSILSHKRDYNNQNYVYEAQATSVREDGFLATYQTLSHDGLRCLFAKGISEWRTSYLPSCATATSVTLTKLIE